MPSKSQLEPTTDEQLKLLWKLLPHPSKSHVVRLFTRTKDGKEKAGEYARTLTELRKFVKFAGDKNVYVAPNPTCSKSGVRHSTADVTHWSYVLLDIDPRKDAVEPDPMNALEFALIWLGAQWDVDLRESSPDRPLIIFSGRGAQAWIRLEDVPLDDSAISRKDARRAMGYWLNAVANSSVGGISDCDVDTSTSDLPRLMRCPGTLNQKTGQYSRIVHPGPSEPYKGLAQRIIERTPANVFIEPEVSDIVPGRRWQDVFQELTRTAQHYLLHGTEAGGRHKAVYSTAKRLCEAGVPIESARKGILRANKLNGPDHAMDRDEVETAMKTAYGLA